jgi:ABC-2 type transport system ATP-binding protein
MAIETRDLVMRFPQQQGWRSLFKHELGKYALRGVTLAIPKGEIFGLLGPNGAGKTTLVKIISTLSIPTEGQAWVTGLDVVRSSLEVRRRLGVVYGDERTFYWRLSALENLMFYGALYHIPARERRDRAMQALEIVGLAQSANIRMHHYSSGMKQRASIARGLLNDPDILIMDEPTRSLDPIAAQELRALVKERVANDHRTVLIATNIMAEAETLCDRIAFMYQGEIQMIGEIGELRGILQADERHQITVGGLTYAALESLRTVPGVDALKLSPADGDRYRIEITVQRDVPAVPGVVRRIVEQGGEVWSCGQRELTLEEMFTIVMEKSRQPSARERVPA